MREKERCALPHVVVYVEYVVYVGHPYVELQLTLFLWQNPLIVQIWSDDSDTPTKGREDLDVARKDARAEQWCADVTALAGAEWHYRKVPQKEFERIKPQSLAELVSVLDAGGSLFI